MVLHLLSEKSGKTSNIYIWGIGTCEVSGNFLFQKRNNNLNDEWTYMWLIRFSLIRPPRTTSQSVVDLMFGSVPVLSCWIYMSLLFTDKQSWTHHVNTNHWTVSNKTFKTWFYISTMFMLLMSPVAPSSGQHLNLFFWPNQHQTKKAKINVWIR